MPTVATPARRTDVYFTVDLEPDCPPFLDTHRGVQEGLPRLLELLAVERVPATFFATGYVARRYPEAIRAVLAAGHELGCHGLTHRRFTSMDAGAARAEVHGASAILREFAPTRSFRAPHLDFPERFLALLEEAEYQVDSSQARYKPAYYRPQGRTSLARVPVSITSPVLRLPRWIREPWLGSLRSPVVLFVHPWEFVDLRREQLPLDCRFSTGDLALRRLGSVIRYCKARGARFHQVIEAAAAQQAAA
ncbi:MAG: polysaccharide deacetylase family protein [Gemmatimonadetes bacterium]|nr:polysaccharide deacetylase family protein [Gemmatimonadota bacterium]